MDMTDVYTIIIKLCLQRAPLGVGREYLDPLTYCLTRNYSLLHYTHELSHSIHNNIIVFSRTVVTTQQKTL